MYREYFDELDKNKDGTIGLNEFKTLMASLKMPASQSTAAVSLENIFFSFKTDQPKE